MAARLDTEHETQGRKLEEVSTAIAQTAHDLAALEKRQQGALEKQFQELSRTIEQTARDLTFDFIASSCPRSTRGAASPSRNLMYLLLYKPQTTLTKFANK